MSRRLTVSLFLLGLLMLPVGNALANELGTPGFETNPVGGAGDWNTFAGGGGAGQSTASPHSGAAHMALEITGPFSFAGVYQPVIAPVNPGDVVTFTGWHKSLDNPFAGVRELKLEWQGGPPQLRVDTFEIGPEYEQFSLQGIAPTGTTGVTATYAISSFTDGHQGAALVFIDDFDLTIQRVPEPTSVMLVLGGVFGLFGLIRRR